MMEASLNWKKLVTRALLIGFACAVGVVFFVFFASHANVVLGRMADLALGPAAFVDGWIFGYSLDNVHYHSGRSFLVTFIAISFQYTVLASLLLIGMRLRLSAKRERRRANGE
jgi:hypothetical protein